MTPLPPPTRDPSWAVYVICRDRGNLTCVAGDAEQ